MTDFTPEPSLHRSQLLILLVLFTTFLVALVTNISKYVLDFRLEIKCRRNANRSRSTKNSRPSFEVRCITIRENKVLRKQSNSLEIAYDCSSSPLPPPPHTLLSPPPPHTHTPPSPLPPLFLSVATALNARQCRPKSQWLVAL